MNLFQRFKKKQAGHRIIYASDLHGNQRHYRLAFSCALELKATIVIFGGDNAPKSPSKRSPEKQLQFFQKGFSKLVSNFRKQIGEQCKIYMIYGNDDFKSYVEDLKLILDEFNVSLLYNDVIDIDEKTKIIGYSYVPITPFKYKDWEKVDVSDCIREDIRDNGYISTVEGSKKIEFDDIKRRGTIEDDLEKLFIDDNKQAIFVAHAPPANTNLDAIGKGRHVGSIAVRRAIEKFHPLISLHGHIHEAFNNSGKFTQILGKTVSINPSHFFNARDVNIVMIDLVNGGVSNILKNVIRINIQNDAILKEISDEHKSGRLLKSGHILREI